MNKFITATLSLTLLLSTASLASLTEVEDTINVPPRKVGATHRRDRSMDLQLAQIADEAILAGSPKKAKTKPKKQVSWSNVLKVRLFENSIVRGDTKKDWGYAKGIAAPNGETEDKIQQEGIRDRILYPSSLRFNDMDANSFSDLSERYPSKSDAGIAMHRKLLKYQKKQANNAAERAQNQNERLEEFGGDHAEYWADLSEDYEKEAQAKVKYFNGSAKDEYIRYQVGKCYAKAASALLAGQETVTEAMDPYLMERYTYLLWNSMYYHMKTVDEGDTTYLHDCLHAFFRSFISLLQVMKDNPNVEQDLRGCEAMLEKMSLIMEPSMRAIKSIDHDVEECAKCQELLHRRETVAQTLAQLEKELD